MCTPIETLVRSLSAAAVLLACGTLEAQVPSTVPQGAVNYLFSAQMPPGAVGAARLQRRGPVQNYYQPVRFSGPEGVRFAMAENGQFIRSEAAWDLSPDGAATADRGLYCGLLVGAVYRFKVTGIPQELGRELFPTVEIIDRTYPPPGQAHRFPIHINLELADLTDALAGRMVTRVVYLEDPQTALPMAETVDTARSLEVMHHQDPLQVADQMGRPVAIVRIGSMTPPNEPSLQAQFFFGGPPWVAMQPPRSEALVPPGEGVAVRTPHIPRNDVPPAPMAPAMAPPSTAPAIAHPYGTGAPMTAPQYRR